MADLSFTEVGEILHLLQAVDGTDVELEWGDLKLRVQRGGPRLDARSGDVQAPAPVQAPLGPVATPESTLQGAPPSPAPAVDAPDDVPEHWVAVRAPMAGTFYRSPKPDEPPYVEVGDLVSDGDTVALVEVMKLFTELKADASGKVAGIPAAEGSMVEFGQVLVWIEPA